MKIKFISLILIVFVSLNVSVANATSYECTPIIEYGPGGPYQAGEECYRQSSDTYTTLYECIPIIEYGPGGPYQAGEECYGQGYDSTSYDVIGNSIIFVFLIIIGLLIAFISYLFNKLTSIIRRIRRR